jgi:DNA-directed RNA polymerase specialized sigma24 family protein
MPHNLLTRTLTAAALIMLLLLGLSHAQPRAGEARRADATVEVAVAPLAPLGWGAIERLVRKGVGRGVRHFDLDDADRDDAAAVAMARAWAAFEAGGEPIQNPEAWGKTIARRVCLDTVRRRRRERARVEPLDAALLTTSPASPTNPFDDAADAQRRELLRRRVHEWPLPERRLAQLVLDGRADTVTAAARIYRAEEEARGEPGTMYPLKAKTLLDARRRELTDLT